MYGFFHTFVHSVLLLTGVLDQERGFTGMQSPRERRGEKVFKQAERTMSGTEEVGWKSGGQKEGIWSREKTKNRQRKITEKKKRDRRTH